MDTMLYEMTFAQLLTMIETRNQRELRAHEAAEEQRRIQAANPGYVPPPPGLGQNASSLPSVSDVEKAFGKFPG